MVDVLCWSRGLREVLLMGFVAGGQGGGGFRVQMEGAWKASRSCKSNSMRSFLFFF